MATVVAVTLSVITMLFFIFLFTFDGTFNCERKGKFDKRHDIKLIETECTKFAACIKCGKRSELDEIDETLFVKRESKKYHHRNDI